MRRAICISVMLCLAAVTCFAQDSSKVLDTFRRNFAIASLDVKIQILQDASAGSAASAMGPLYQQAVDFVCDNASLILTDARFNQLAGIAAEQIGLISYTKAKDSLWKLFKTTSDSQTLGVTATALGIVGAGDPDVVLNLNRYVEAQNNLFLSGKQPDNIVLPACFQALGRLEDPSSFPVLFSSTFLGYNDKASAVAREALFSIKGDFKELLRGVIKDRPVTEKKLGLQMALDSDRLTNDQKAQLAQFALDIGLHSSVSDTDSKTVLRDMRFQAAASLGARKWSDASSLLIEHLDMTIGEFDKGFVDRNHLLDAIANLGAMNTHEAAVRLTQYLVLLNSYAEKGKVFDDQIVFAVLQNLGALGDKVAFDDLMYTQYLNYSAGVKKAARAALDKLKW